MVSNRVSRLGSHPPTAVSPVSEAIEATAAAERMQLVVDAYAQIRSAMRAAPQASGKRRSARKIPPGILERASVVVFPDLAVLRQAFLPVLGDRSARRLLTDLIERRQFFLAENVDPILAVQALRAEDGAFEFVPIVVAPMGAPAHVGLLEVQPCRGVRVGE